MRETGNFLSAWVGSDRGTSFRNTVSIVLVAAAIGAVASSAVVEFLVDAPVITPGPPHSVQAIIANPAISSTAQVQPPQAAPLASSVMPTAPGVATPKIEPHVDVQSGYNPPVEARMAHRSSRWWRLPLVHYPPDGSIRSER